MFPCAGHSTGDDVLDGAASLCGQDFTAEASEAYLDMFNINAAASRAGQLGNHTSYFPTFDAAGFMVAEALSPPRPAPLRIHVQYQNLQERYILAFATLLLPTSKLHLAQSPACTMRFFRNRCV